MKMLIYFTMLLHFILKVAATEQTKKAENTEVYPDIPLSTWSLAKLGKNDNPDLYSKWYYRMIMSHFEMMTEEINKQVFQKLKHAEKYVELDDETNIYMMGKMSESMKERFKSMIITYKMYNKYSQMPEGHYHVMERQLAALELMEGEYNRILFERRQYHKALQAYYEELMISSKRAHEATRVIEERRRGVGRTPLIQDSDYKMQLRKKKFEEKRASFNPEVEGIDVDLGYLN